MRVSVRKTSELPRTPWKNGLGTTREIARGGQGPDGWAWRLSLADVERDDAFSRFPGCERTLALLAGDGLTLHVANNAPLRLAMPLAFARFSGDDDTRGALLGGPTLDFNVMTRRDDVEHEVLTLVPGLVVAPADAVALLLLDGELLEPVALKAGEVALLERPATPLPLVGHATGLVVRLWSRHSQAGEE